MIDIHIFQTGGIEVVPMLPCSGELKAVNNSRKSIEEFRSRGFPHVVIRYRTLTLTFP
jgi:hypothetical protein